MSELPQETKPDLHAILGLDNAAGQGEHPNVSLDPVVTQRPEEVHAEPADDVSDEVAPSGERAPESDQSADGQAGRGDEEPENGGDGQAAHGGGDGAGSGITGPSRAGSPRRRHHPRRSLASPGRAPRARPSGPRHLPG